MRSDRSEIRWQTEKFGVFDPSKDSDESTLPQSDRFGTGSSPLINPPPGQDCDCECDCKDGGVSHTAVYENHLSADTETSATLEAWTDLPGLSRTIGVDRNAIAWVNANVVVECADLSDVAGAECRIRILVNGEETSGHSRWSVTNAYIKTPGKNVMGVVTLACQAQFAMKPDEEYLYKVQIANFGAATTFEAVMGSGGGSADSNMTTVVFLGTLTDKPGGTKPKPDAEGSNWVRILDIGYARATDLLYVLRIRGEYDNDDDTPASDVVPDRAYIEVVTYDYSAMPLTATLGGTIIWKRLIATVSLWQGAMSLMFSVDPSGGGFGVCWTLGYEPTSTSKTYYFAMATKGGQTAFYETWDGPNWHNDVDGYSALFSSGIWSGIYFYCVVPTTDTAAKSSSAPFKSGWRLVKRNGLTLSGSITTLTWGNLVSQKDLLPEAGQRFKIPLCLVYDGGDARLLLLERIGVGNQKMYLPTADTVIAGGALGSEVILGGFVPDAGQTVWLWLQAVPNTYIFVRQGFSDIYTWGSGGSTVALWDDSLYLGAYEYNKIEILSRPTNEVIMFDRGAQGNSLTASWVRRVPGNQGGVAGNQ